MQGTHLAALALVKKVAEISARAGCRPRRSAPAIR